MFPWYVFTAAFFTAIFYYFDLRKKCDIRYFSHLSYWGLKSILGKYLVLYFILGLGISYAHELGFSVFKGQVSPFEQLSKFIIPGQNPPTWAKNILLSVIIAWTIRLVLSTKILPLFSGTLDSVIDKFFFINLESDQKHSQLTGKNGFIDTQLKAFQKKTGSALNVATFGKSLITYIEQMDGLKDPKYVALIQDVGALSAENEIEKAIRICLPIFSRTQVKSIIASQTANGSTAHSNTFVLEPRYVFVGSFIVVVLVFIVGIYFSNDEIPTKEMESAESKYIVNFSTTPSNNKTLDDIYKQSNAELIDTLTNLKSKLDSGVIFHGTMLLAAPSGEGKTSFIDCIRKELFKEKTVVVNFESLINDNDILTFTESSSVPIKDSESDSIVRMGRVYDIKAFHADSLIKKLNPAFDGGFIVIDELDRLSDDAIRYVISEFQKMGKSTKFIYLIFVGQPDIFNYYIKNIPSVRAKICSPYSLNEIKFSTLVDLKIRVRNYGETHRQRWTEDRIDQITEQLFEKIKNSPHLSYSIQNLYISNEIISQVANSNGPISDLKDEIFTRLLDRAHDIHGRPNVADDELFRFYKAALMSIAVKHAKTKSHGRFKLRPNEKHFFTYQGKTWSVNPVDLLNRSGLVTVEPFDTDEGEYRFSPFWIHRYLLDEYNANQTAL